MVLHINTHIQHNHTRRENTLREICFDAVTNNCREDSKDNPEISCRDANGTNNGYLYKQGEKRIRMR